jgi:exodeoxyribonuclease-3
MRASDTLKSAPSERAIIVGDLNVAPLECDVWSHKQLLSVVSHTPVECEKLLARQNAGGWIDAVRGLVPEPTKLYTWWSYRSPNWQRADKGRRLDHIGRRTRWLTAFRLLPSAGNIGAADGRRTTSR